MMILGGVFRLPESWKLRLMAVWTHFVPDLQKRFSTPRARWVLNIANLKADSQLDNSKVGYRCEGKESLTPPTGAEALAICEPVYVEMPGWKESTVGVKRYESLPAEARKYLARIEEIVGTRIDIISTGPDRADTIVLRDPFAED